MHFDRHQLTALAAILQHGSFDAAAAALYITPSAVSQRLKALETRVGATLIQRGSPSTGTPEGLRLARLAQELALLETRALQDLGFDGDSPQIRIAVNADSLDTWLLPALAQTPSLHFAIQIDDQDHSADWLRNGAVSAAITARATPVRGCDSLALGALPYVATASPAFIAKWLPDGPTPAALAKAPVLTFNAKDRLQSRWLHQVAGKPLSPPGHELPSTQGFVTACRLGMGWGLNPAPLVARDLARGTLIALCPDLQIATPLYWQVARRIAPDLAPLTQALRSAARNTLKPPPASSL